MRTLLFTLISPRLHGRARGPRLQVGRRERRGALLRPAAPECREGAGGSRCRPTRQRTPTRPRRRRRRRAPPQGPAYTGCTIAQPQDNQDFPNLEQLRIVVFTNPGLRAGDQVFMVMDGASLGGGQRHRVPAEPGGARHAHAAGDGEGWQRHAPVPDAAGHLQRRTSPRSRTRSTPSGRTEPQPRARRPRTARAGAPWPLSTALLRRSRTSTPPTCSMHCRPAS